VREVKEETGLMVELDAPIGSIQYWFVRSNDGVRCHKTVHFYLMSPVGGSFSDHDQEFDEVRWSPSKEALGDLAYKNEINILEKAVEIVSQRARKRDL
jgi:8-oxo-dGTP pyrophosphatase MutT (NUDIX family)